MLVGGIALLIVFNIFPAEATETPSYYRSFSENHIQVAIMG